jgi:hypothetical protein
MNNHITYEQIIQRFEENSLPYASMPLSDEVDIIVSQRGGRILGPFAGGKRESLYWMNGAFAGRDKFTEFLESGDWNLGGDRIWIAPELQYNVKNREDFFGSYALPEQVDPGSYSLEKLSGNPRLPKDRYVLEQEMNLAVYGSESKGPKELTIRRTVSAAEDPLRELDSYEELRENVIYAGYEHAIRLAEKKNDGLLSEAWDLSQINPGGSLYVSLLPGSGYTDYYRPIDDEYQQMHHGYAKLKINGTRQYKVGYKGIFFLGRVGYHNAFEDGQHYFLVRNFFSNPSAVYTKEPSQSLGCKGHPLHVYNDDNTYGGFAEVECSGQALGGNTGRSESEDRMQTWLYIGKLDKIKRIARTTMGVDLSE